MLHFDAEQLYREIILEHSKNPHNVGLMPNKKTYNIKNPSCGDDVSMQIVWGNDDTIKSVVHHSIGCAISTASTSILSDLLVGKTKKQALQIINAYVSMTKGESFDKKIELQDASVFSGVANYPARFKCATIAWELAKNIIEKHKTN